MEHEQEKEDLFETIREQDKELKFMSRVVEILLTREQLDTVKAVSDWDDEARAFRIPEFCLRDRKVNFPKLKSLELKEYIESEKAKKELAFEPEKAREDERKNSSYQSAGSTSRSIREDARLRLSNMSVDKVETRYDKKNFNVQLQPVGSREIRDRTRNLALDEKVARNSKLEPILGPPVFRKL